MTTFTACTEWDADTDAAMDALSAADEAALAAYEAACAAADEVRQAARQAAWATREEAEAKAAAEYHSAIAVARMSRGTL